MRSRSILMCESALKIKKSPRRYSNTAIFFRHMRILALAILAIPLALVACQPDSLLPDSLSALRITHDTVWSTGSTVSISGKLRVDGAKLSIEPGVHLKFAPGASLVVGEGGAANIVIRGSMANPVVIEPQDALGSFTGIRIIQTGGQSSIANCEIRRAGNAQTAGLWISNLNFPIEGLDIIDSQGDGIRIDYADASRPYPMKNCRIQAHGHHAIAGNASLLASLNRTMRFTLDQGYGVRIESGTILLPRGKLDFYPLGAPYIVTSNICLDAPELVMHDGVEFRFEPQGGLEFACEETTKLTATGVTFTSTATSKAQGQWLGLLCNSRLSPSSVFDHCTIEAGGRRTPNAAGITIDGVKNLTVTNCNINRNKGYGILLLGKASIKNQGASSNSFEGNELGDIGQKRGKR